MISIGTVRTMMTEPAKATRSRVLLADDHQIVLDTENQILSAEFEIVGSVRTGSAVMQAVAEFDPDVITLDITMPELNGLEVARRLKSRGSRAKIVFLTVHDDPDFVDEALKAGALGYVVKATMASDLLQAMHAALGGRQFISPTIRMGDAGSRAN